MSMRVAYLAIAAVGLAAAPVTAKTVKVTNAGDSAAIGSGSFRAAVEEANADPSVTKIKFDRGLGTIVLDGTITYGDPFSAGGGQSLGIDGKGAVIRGDGNQLMPGTFDLFESTEGADLSFEHLTFRDGDHGIRVRVPALAVGLISVSLSDVTVVRNHRFGLKIEEEDPGPGEPYAASIDLVVMSSHFARNGLVEDDVDAVRVNERGEGDITAVVMHSSFTRNGADGFELDEEGAGDAVLTVRHSRFDRNGQTRTDGDDGLDVDESDAGSIWLSVTGSTFNRNTDDGVGLDETGAGDLHIALTQVEAMRNTDSGVSADESDAGDYEIKFTQVSADHNRDKGADMTEEGDGDFDGRAVRSSFSANDDDGIAVEQLDAGTGVLELINVTLSGNGNAAVDADGVDVIVIP